MKNSDLSNRRSLAVNRIGKRPSERRRLCARALRNSNRSSDNYYREARSSTRPAPARVARGGCRARNVDALFGARDRDASESERNSATSGSRKLGARRIYAYVGDGLTVYGDRNAFRAPGSARATRRVRLHVSETVFGHVARLIRCERRRYARMGRRNDGRRAPRFRAVLRIKKEVRAARPGDHDDPWFVGRSIELRRDTYPTHGKHPVSSNRTPAAK